MSYTKANHNVSYPAISASNPANSAAGKVVLITGAGSGIGQAAATSFAPASAKALILIGRRTEPLTKTAAIISQKGPDVQVRLHGADINDVKTLKSVMAETVSTFGQIGIVIHAAGVLLALGPISTMPVEELWKALGVKIKGTLNVAQSLSPIGASEKSAGSKPVLVSLNTAGMLMPPIPGMGGYIVSKAVLPKLVEYLAAENPDKLSIVTIHPSLIRTPMAVELEEAALKFPYDDDPGLKVFIAIGGWTFNDPGPTTRTFSDLAASVTKQKAFIESLMSFMSTYGFDGVDLDWEYAVAEDRSGRGVDYVNFPKFMSRLKASFNSGQKGISITLPASFWYLQHFDIIALAKTAHWFNIMSCDLHGTWDKNTTWVGACLNARSNLTEVDLALDLLWRNNINPSQVVMGLGFSKIVQEKEAVKVAAWGNPAQCVACDDEETFQLKSEYDQTLAKVANRKILFLLVNVGLKDDLIEFVDIPNEQCRWINCNVGCAPGWAIVPRRDPGARGKEYIFDQTGSDGTAFHAFCCPATWKQPKCG
ncbi:hypothetical protein CPAR01_06484 [Colletotrichum paranaense]|uniref:chitinase n=1 Tax=Colletotrichum paranaense TaxID=1914294 RepID=A0ABQ9SLW7_9PEZI|nr:uncharacterized protein CPAR01_06484 [Colletotrichum paranaense]KAK1540495.1 hypothetical protein CPAR01_06484 [Colletotrichum paranaense]